MSVGSPNSLTTTHPGPHGGTREKVFRTRKQRPSPLAEQPTPSPSPPPPTTLTDSGAMVAGARRGGRRHLLVGVLLLALVVSGHCLDAHHSSRNLKRRRKKHEIHSPVKTVVVVVMENRSFDHILGWLRAGRPDIDGLTGAESNRLNLSDPASPEIFVTDRAGYVDSDPGHGFEDIQEQIFGSTDTSASPAPMSGFAQNARGMGPGMPQDVMSGFAPDSVPVYAMLADEFAVFGCWFTYVPTASRRRPSSTASRRRIEQRYFDCKEFPANDV